MRQENAFGRRGNLSLVADVWGKVPGFRDLREESRRAEKRVCKRMNGSFQRR